MSSASQSAAAPRVPLHNILSFGTLGVPLSALAVIFGVYLPRHFVSLGIGDFRPGAKTAFLAVTAAITLTRVIDIAFDPLVALAMDRTKTPIGRYRPWLVLGSSADFRRLRGPSRKRPSRRWWTPRASRAVRSNSF